VLSNEFADNKRNFYLKGSNIMKKQRWQDAINLLLGLWIFFAPWIFGSRAGAMAIGSYTAVGSVVTFFAISGLAEFRLWKEWVNILFGAWMLISPWILHFSNLAGLAWNAVVSGAVVIVCACWALGDERGRRPLVK
jgi:hypothetical protein